MVPSPITRYSVTYFLIRWSDNLTLVLDKVIKSRVANLVICESHEQRLLLFTQDQILIWMIVPFRIVNIINIDQTLSLMSTKFFR